VYWLDFAVLRYSPTRKLRYLQARKLRDLQARN
jgi:hypothetical protein